MDPDDDPLTFAVANGPLHGGLSGTAPNLTYTPELNFNGDDHFTFKVTAAGRDSPEATISITVVPVNDPPVVTTTGAALPYVEGGGAVLVDDGLGISDVDSPTLVGATVSLTRGFDPGGDVLAFGDQWGITGAYNAGTGILSLSGTAAVADYQAALRTVTYQNTSRNPAPPGIGSRSTLKPSSPAMAILARPTASPPRPTLRQEASNSSRIA